jgi:anti-anti-sigma factor
MCDSTPDPAHNSVYVVECEPHYESDDVAAMARAREALIDRLTEIHQPRVVVDLSETQFFGSAFVGLLFALREQVVQLGGRLATCCANDQCRSVLEVTHFTRVCPLFSSQSEAVESVTK